MVIIKVTRVCWELGAAPDKLEVLASLFLSELFKHCPEHLDRLVVSADTLIGCNCLERLEIDVLGATSPQFDLLPSQEGQDREINDIANSLSNPLHLLFGLFEPSFRHQIEVIFVVSVGDGRLLAIMAKLDSLSVGQIGLECLVNGCIEGLWGVSLAVLSGLFQHLVRVSIKPLKVNKGHGLAEKLLPKNAREVPVHS